MKPFCFLGGFLQKMILPTTYVKLQLHSQTLEFVMVVTIFTTIHALKYVY